MKKNLTLLMFIPALFIFVFINYYIDPANIFHNENAAIAKEILAGNRVYITSGNGDERGVKKNLIENMPKKVDCLAIGPSLIMGIRTSDVGTESFYNLGVSGADYYDILGYFALLEINEIEYEKIILCVDPYFFSSGIYEYQTRHESLLPYAEYMIALLDEQEVSIPYDGAIVDMKTQIEQIFSVTYFQSAIAQMQTADALLKEERWGIVNEEMGVTEYPYYCSDGSWVYAKSYQEKWRESILPDVQSYDMNYQFSRNQYMSVESKATFEKLVSYLVNKGVDVSLFLCPLSPSLWSQLEKEQASYPILAEIENYTHEISNIYGIEVIGSYNPNNIDISDLEYYDARHIRHEALSKYFDFTR